MSGANRYLVHALDEALTAVRVDPGACRHCGGLGPDSRSLLFLGPDEEPRRCPGCRHYLDRRGRAVGHLGAPDELRVVIITLKPGEQEPEVRI